jgi:hypothetical protein
MEIIQVGTQYSSADPEGTQGYDGQFVYYIARDLNPESVAPLIDNPAYRYQRILLPLSARLLSLGQVVAIPWALLAIGLLSHGAGTWFVDRALVRFNVSRWYALSYALWVGQLLAVRLALPEPLAYALTAAALGLLIREELDEAEQTWRSPAAWALLGLAIFTKEVTAIFAAGVVLNYVIKRRWTQAFWSSLIFGVPFALFQLWLFAVFGHFGLGSGGAMATPFEFVPFMGLVRIAEFSWVFFLALALLYIPFLYLPSLWGLWQGIKSWRQGSQSVLGAAVLVNALIIPFIPFSTVREPGAMFRFGSGLILAVLLVAAQKRHKRVLNYSFLWLIMLTLLLNE